MEDWGVGGRRKEEKEEEEEERRRRRKRGKQQWRRRRSRLWKNETPGISTKGRSSSSSHPPTHRPTSYQSAHPPIHSSSWANELFNRQEEARDAFLKLLREFQEEKSQLDSRRWVGGWVGGWVVNRVTKRERESLTHPPTHLPLQHWSLLPGPPCSESRCVSPPPSFLPPLVRRVLPRHAVEGGYVLWAGDG